MKPTFALVVLATLSPCLFAIERINAAPSDSAAAAPVQSLRPVTEKGLFVPVKADADECCEESCGSEKACCAEKACDGGKKCCSEKPCCKNGTSINKGASKLSSSLERIGLKLFWTLPLTPGHKTGFTSAEISQPCPGGSCADSVCAKSACADSACAKSVCGGSACGDSACADSAAASSTVAEYPLNPCSSASKVYYAAIPAAVPSPFGKGTASAPALAAQAYAATLPLQAPPAPVAQASATVDAAQPGPCSKCVKPQVAPHPVKGTAHISLATASETQLEAAQVSFNVDLIEDRSGCLTEFESLQGDMPFLTAESEIVLATVRILEKQKLLRRISSPQLVTPVGQTALLQVGTESVRENGNPSFSGLRIETAARELGGGLEVEFKFCDTTGHQCYEIATSLLIAHGQTVVMKACHPNTTVGDAADEGTRQHPVYIVLTPQILK